MKFLTYLFAFLLVISSVSAICYNQNDLPFCSKDDPTCEQVGDVDTDGDGWTNSCDAFPENKYFWVDYDGDNIGWGTDVYDCDDLDDSNTLFCGNTDLLKEGPGEESESTGSSGSSTTQVTSFSSRKPGSHTGPVIYVSDPNDNFVVNQPVNEQNEEEPVEDNYPETEIVPLDDPVPVDKNPSGNQITGAVTGTSQNFVIWPFFALLLAVLIMFFFALRKKKN